MGFVHSKLNPGVDGMEEFSKFLPGFLAANYHEVLAARGIIPDLRKIIVGYWFPTTDLTVIKQHLIGWKQESNGKPVEYQYPDGWSEAFAPFMVQMDFPFITPSHLPVIGEKEVLVNDGCKHSEYDEYFPVAEDDTLLDYQRMSSSLANYLPDNGSVDEIRNLAAKFTFVWSRTGSVWLLSNLTHVDVSPLPTNQQTGFSTFTSLHHAMRLAAPTMDAATWNKWFGQFMDNIKQPSSKARASKEYSMKCAFFMLGLDLKCDLNLLTPWKLYEPCQLEFYDRCHEWRYQMNRVGFKSRIHFESCVKALQARVDVANDTLSIPANRKRKVEQ
jgi:hypothetical protein